MRYDVAVLGSGAGGLTAALALARAGRSVIVLEAATDIGGMLNPFKRGKFVFDVGLHYVGQCGPGQAMRGLLDELGLEAVRFREIDPDNIDRYVFDGYEVTLVKGMDRWADNLAAQFPGEERSIRSFFTLMKAADAAMKLAMRGPRLDSWRALHPGLVQLVRKPLGEVLASYFRNPLLRNAFAGPGGDLGVPPGKASALSSVLLLTHYLKGAYYPEGGSGAMRDAMVAGIEKAGGVLRTKAEVTRISPGFRIRTGDEEIEAGTVVSNIDAAQTVALLDGLTPNARTKRQLRPSLGTLCVFLGLDTDDIPVGAGNIWHYGRNDLDEVYAPLYRGEIPDYSAYFLSSPTKKGAMDAPPGQSTLELISFLPSQPFREWWEKPALKRGPAYQAMKRELADRLVNDAERYVPGLKGHIKVTEIGTPATVWHYVRGRDGGIYGPEQSPDQAGPFRMWPTTGVPGLYLCGASVLGGGVFPCMLSGRIAARLAMSRKSAG
jgi:phytoene dehydrogenase-like protein